MYKGLRENLPGVPRAPGPKFFHSAAQHFEDEKQRLQNRLPLLNTEELIRYRSPYIVLFQQLLSLGYQHVVDEILELKEQEYTEVQQCRRARAILLRDTKLLGKIAGVLKICRRLEVNHKHLKAARGRYRLAEELLQDGDLWLARYFITTSLITAEKDKSEDSYEFQAKMHCLLAHLAKEYYPKLEDRIANTVDHLETALMLSKNQPWLYRTKHISIPLRTPIAVYGLREETTEEWNANYTVYKQSMLIYYDLLMTLSDPKAPLHHTADEISIAYKLAEEALHMAKETRNGTAIMSALLRCGMIMRRIGRFVNARNCFDQLLYEAEFAKDHETQALAYANVGHCYQAQRQPDEALNWFYMENELATEKQFLELQADSFEHMGFIMLQEGVLTEAELSLREAYQLYKQSLPKHKDEEFFKLNANKQKSFTDSTWAFAAMAAGVNLWGRVAGLCRQAHNNYEALDAIVDWKDRRDNLIRVPKPSQSPAYADEIVGGLDEHQIPIPPPCDLECIKHAASSMLKVVAVDQSGVFVPTKPRLPTTRDWRSSLPGDNTTRESTRDIEKLMKHVRYISDGREGDEQDGGRQSIAKSTRSSYGEGILSPRTSRASRILSFARGSSTNEDLVVEDGRVLGYLPSRSHSMLIETEVGEIRSTMMDVRPSIESQQLQDYADEKLSIEANDKHNVDRIEEKTDTTVKASTS